MPSNELAFATILGDGQSDWPTDTQPAPWQQREKKNLSFIISFHLTSFLPFRNGPSGCRPFFFYFRGKYAAVVDCTDIPGAYLVLSYDFVVATGSRSAGQASWLADKFIVRWAASFCWRWGSRPSQPAPFSGWTPGAPLFKFLCAYVGECVCAYVCVRVCVYLRAVGSRVSSSRRKKSPQLVDFDDGGDPPLPPTTLFSRSCCRVSDRFLSTAVFYFQHFIWFEIRRQSVFALAKPAEVVRWGEQTSRTPTETLTEWWCHFVKNVFFSFCFNKSNKFW